MRAVADIEAVAEDMTARRLKRHEKPWSLYMPRNPIASDLSDCGVRYQVMRVFGWELRGSPNAQAKETIEHGNVMEPAVIRQLELEGWEIVEQQAPLEIRQPLVPDGPRKTILTGRIDGKLWAGGELVPFDVKSTSQWTLEGLRTQADLKNQSQWTRKWWRQMLVYMLGENCETGLLILAFRGQRRAVPLTLDYEEGEELLQMCSESVRLVEELKEQEIGSETVDEALRGLVPYCEDPLVCRSCAYKDRACFPPDVTASVTDHRPALAPIAATFHTCKPFASQYEKAKRQLKEATEGVAATIAGQYVIHGKVTTRHMKEKPAVGAHTTESWQVTVDKPTEEKPETAEGETDGLNSD